MAVTTGSADDHDRLALAHRLSQRKLGCDEVRRRLLELDQPQAVALILHHDFRIELASVCQRDLKSLHILQRCCIREDVAFLIEYKAGVVALNDTLLT